ncbi:5-formyltetrahydrofolate cyclo-ligase [Campylobacter sp. MIT 21-1685]|uniref:5-formyltetrahydrofolate cyclo-ligase n=1 Tax=unclassified Campylobacter TaxID=2593542 RepID=UPI00224AD594|nr:MULTISPECIES: 5-formyltetrahydrofolate cyclo-ligase [unclassified Campylobacter]MCX2682545.1 5-formyltetrahydrofolate cyclo-ligase [Campylobacter sp. MIT 21-1684]MCX2750742.1 5-formyltetrahydrofolate cyclo-ligase [Campylobacter sp. MIT 21-1682]MCX2807026.1 5-formyltetrahydrofolate cyclo-ligase [Campylobacter sp. MIT 21-1685]
MQKSLFREEQRIRLSRQKKYFFKKDFLVFKECFKLIKKSKIKNILLFIPLVYEPNLLKFRKVLNQNYKLFVPFMQDKSLKIVKLRLPFIKKRFGVLESNNSFLKVVIDVAIVPVIGIDKNFKRIGHGQGFYDRFFSELTYKPVIIFTQSIDSLSEKTLSQQHDIVGDFYINPHKKYYKKENTNVNNGRSYRRYSRHWNRIFSRKKN